MPPRPLPSLLPRLLGATFIACLPVAAIAQARRRPAGGPVRKASPSRPAPAPVKPPPASGNPATAPRVTAATLGATLQSLGYKPAADGGFQRVMVEEPGFGYAVDLSYSKSGAWVICVAHLAPVSDLTRVPASPLLSLLATNDSLVGMYFSYSRTSGQIMLNSAVPAAGLTPEGLRAALEGMKTAIRDTQNLWDTARW